MTAMAAWALSIRHTNNNFAMACDWFCDSCARKTLCNIKFDCLFVSLPFHRHCSALMLSCSRIALLTYSYQACLQAQHGANTLWVLQ